MQPNTKQQDMMRYAGLATQWMVMLAMAVWGGYHLDKKIGVSALFIIVFPVLALAVSLWQLIKQLNKPKK